MLLKIMILKSQNISDWQNLIKIICDELVWRFYNGKQVATKTVNFRRDNYNL